MTDTQNQNKGDCLIQFKLPEKLKYAMDACMADQFVTSRSAFMRGLVIKAVRDYLTGQGEGEYE